MNTGIQKPPRPVITDDIIKQAAQCIAFLTENLSKAEQIELGNAIIQCYRSGDNGYELTKKIKDTRLNFNIHFDSTFVETMDEMDITVIRFHRQKCELWVQEFAIQPPLPIGTLIKQGEITGICAYYPAYYLVKAYERYGLIDKERLVIKFEDAVANKVWVRNNEVIYHMLLMISDVAILPRAIETWTNEQCRQVEIWASAVHQRASDSKDVIVPPMPAFIQSESTQAVQS